MSKQNLTVTMRQNTGSSFWSGTANVPGLAPAKLVRPDGTNLFQSRQSLQAAARNLGKRLGMDVEVTAPTRKAAKKTPVTTTPTT
jgi:hypothetical protein